MPRWSQDGIHSFVGIISRFSDPTPEGIERNKDAARKLARDIALNGGLPLAGHLLFPQFLDDKSPTERELGIELGQIFIIMCDYVVIYRPDGVISSGMKSDIECARDYDLQLFEAFREQDGTFTFKPYERA